MEKENYDHFQDETSTNLKTKGNEQVLEISSTGYGLESISRENSEKLHPRQTENHKNPSCGGL